MAIINTTWRLTTCLAGLLLLLNSAPALANVACGETLTVNTTLILNMTCPGTALRLDG